MQHTIDKKSLLNFLKKHTWGVLSTVNKKGLPHAAPIYYVVDDDLNLFFITPEKTQKSLDIEFQNEVVFTVTDEPRRETVRVEGLAKKEATLVPQILKELAKQLNQEGKFVTTLPLLSYKDQEKVGVMIKPKQICMRSYSEEGMRETVVNFKG